MDTGTLSELSPEAQRQLLEAANERISATTVAFYHVPTFVYFCILYFSAKLVHACFYRYSATYKALSNANQRTTVIYVLNIVYTILALALQLVASPTLAEDYTLLGAHCIKLVGLIISGLYLFELMYREWMRWPMLIHHFATLFAILFVGTAIDETLQPAYLVAGLLWLFQATTEQSVFVGLLLYRLKYPPGLVSKTLKVAAIQSTLCKIVFAIYLLVWWGIKQARNNESSIDIAFSCILVIVILLLLATQLWGALVVWRIGAQVHDRYVEDEKADRKKTHSIALQPDSTITLATIPEDGVPAPAQVSSQSRNSVVDMTRKMKKRISSFV